MTEHTHSLAPETGSAGDAGFLCHAQGHTQRQHC